MDSPSNRGVTPQQHASTHDGLARELQLTRARQEKIMEAIKGLSGQLHALWELERQGSASLLGMEQELAALKVAGAPPTAQQPSFAPRALGYPWQRTDAVHMHAGAPREGPVSPLRLLSPPVSPPTLQRSGRDQPPASPVQTTVVVGAASGLDQRQQELQQQQSASIPATVQLEAAGSERSVTPPSLHGGEDGIVDSDGNSASSRSLGGAHLAAPVGDAHAAGAHAAGAHAPALDGGAHAAGARVAHGGASAQAEGEQQQHEADEQQEGDQQQGPGGDTGLGMAAMGDEVEQERVGVQRGADAAEEEHQQQKQRRRQQQQVQQQKGGDEAAADMVEDEGDEDEGDIVEVAGAEDTAFYYVLQGEAPTWRGDHSLHAACLLGMLVWHACLGGMLVWQAQATNICACPSADVHPHQRASVLAACSCGFALGSPATS